MVSKLGGLPHQTTFAHAEFAAKQKTTRREKFLARREEVIPWAKLLAVIEPHDPKGQRGRPPHWTGADVARLLPPALVWAGR